jgi:hypothetical protein
MVGNVIGKEMAWIQSGEICVLMRCDIKFDLKLEI